VWSGSAREGDLMPEPLIILGVSGNAYDILDIVDAINSQIKTWHPAGFLDDTLPTGSLHSGLPVLGKLAEAPKFGGHWFINAIGSERSYKHRPALIRGTGLRPERFATLIHPMAQVSNRSKLGRGVCVNFGASIAGSTVIGDHVSVGPGCIIGHDTAIGDHTILAPGCVISGFVKVESVCYIGAAAAIRQRLRIGKGALVGMGSAVIRDVADDTVAAGNPARTLPRKPRPDQC